MEIYWSRARIIYLNVGIVQVVFKWLSVKSRKGVFVFWCIIDLDYLQK